MADLTAKEESIDGRDRKRRVIPAWMRVLYRRGPVPPPEARLGVVL
jgi:hypothetical protein